MLKQSLRAALGEVHPDRELRKWFDPLMLQIQDDASLSVCFPHAYFSHCLSPEKRELLEVEAKRVLGRPVRLIFRNPARVNRVGNSQAIPSRPQTSALGEGFTFAGFITNQKNAFPVDMAREAAVHPGDAACYPFVICGRGTCGKTHLLRAMARELEKTFPAEFIYVGTAPDLALKRQVDPALLGSISNFQAIFLDDAQLLVRWPDLQQDLIALADIFHESGKSLVLAFDDSLGRIGLVDKLRSRLEAGLVVSLKRPDLDVRLRFTLAESERLGLDLARQHALLIAQKFQDVRLISGILTKVSAFRKRLKRHLNDLDIRRILDNTAHAGTGSLTAETIIALVCNHFSLSTQEVLGSGRKREATRARQIAMFLSREMLGLSYPAIGEIFGGRNHATVVHAYKKIQQLQEGDSLMNNLVSTLRNKCLNCRS